MITMWRTASSTPWPRVEELVQDYVMPCGDAIAAVFARSGCWPSWARTPGPSWAPS